MVEAIIVVECVFLMQNYCLAVFDFSSKFQTIEFYSLCDLDSAFLQY